MDQETTVLIVGAGPTGLAAACALAEMGVDFQIIDKKSSPIETSNAIALQSRTLEIFDHFGVIEEAIALGRVIHGMRLYENTKQALELSFSCLDAPYPYILALPQQKTEQLLTQKLKLQGIKVQRGVELESFIQTTNGVETVLQHAEERMQLRCKYLLACEGKHSNIRKQLKIPFIGSKLEQHFIMADVELDSKLDKQYAYSFIASEGVFAVIHTKDFARVIVDVTNDPKLKTVTAPTGEDFEYARLKRCSNALAFEKFKWMTHFNVYKHCATQFSVGNVFLLGDSAHEHSPVGGQGMNTGIQDAYNLAWKIYWVIKQKAPSKFLKSYEKERIVVAKAVVKNTTKFTQLLLSSNTFIKKMRSLFFSVLSKSQSLQHKMISTLSQLDIKYNPENEYNTANVIERFFSKRSFPQGMRIPTILRLDKSHLLNIKPYINLHTLTCLVNIDNIHSADRENFLNIIKTQSDCIFLVELSAKQSTLNERKRADSALLSKIKLKPGEYMVIRPDYYVALYGKINSIGPLLAMLDSIRSY